MWEPGASVLEGRFRILQAVGVTSATENYLAEQVSLARKVSLRVIRPELGVRPDAGERFEREVKRIAAVDHPNVVRVIDSGRFYLVTEAVDGATLSGDEPLLPERALELLTQIAEALSAVHEQGLVHGELNPSMVVVSGARARLLDFGVARLLDAESPDERVTVATRAITAPDFLSPEQLRGKDATAASDVFALGRLAQRLLAGKVALAKSHLSDQHALLELVARCVEEDAGKRPTAREAWQKFAKVPRPAEPTLFVEAMQRPPELPKAAEPAVKQLPKLLESVPMLALTPAEPLKPLPPPLPTPKKSSRWPFVAVGAVLLATVAAIAGLGLTASPAREARQLIENRQPTQALETLSRALRKKGMSTNPELLALRCAALHLAELHRDEELTFKALPAGAAEALDPLVLAGVVEDFGRREEAGLRAALKALPANEVRAVLEGFAKEPVSMKQWGALRYLDLEGSAGGLKVVELYSVSLESSACPVRKLAAKRLQELDDDSAVEALMRLKETPREGSDKGCGQDEAAAAVQSLKTARSP